MLFLPSGVAMLLAPVLARFWDVAKWLMVVLAAIQGFFVLLLAGRRERGLAQLVVVILASVVAALAIFAFLMCLMFFVWAQRQPE